MPTLLEVKFTNADGKLETDTRVESIDAANLTFSVPTYCALAKLPVGAEVTEVVIAHHGEPRWTEKRDRVRVTGNQDMLNGYHVVSLEDSTET